MAGNAHHPLAFLENPAVGTGCLDHPKGFSTRSERQFRFHLVLSLDAEQIREIQTRAEDPDFQLRFFRNQTRYFLPFQDFRGFSKFFLNPGFHDFMD